jgi:hypothetical protein
MISPCKQTGASHQTKNTISAACRSSKAEGGARSRSQAFFFGSVSFFAKKEMNIRIYQSLNNLKIE